MGQVGRRRSRKVVDKNLADAILFGDLRDGGRAVLDLCRGEPRLRYHPA